MTIFFGACLCVHVYVCVSVWAFLCLRVSLCTWVCTCAHTYVSEFVCACSFTHALPPGSPCPLDIFYSLLLYFLPAFLSTLLLPFPSPLLLFQLLFIFLSSLFPSLLLFSLLRMSFLFIFLLFFLILIMTWSLLDHFEYHYYNIAIVARMANKHC